MYHIVHVCVIIIVAQGLLIVLYCDVLYYHHITEVIYCIVLYCRGYVTAELCFNQTQCSSASDQTDILRLKELYKSGYQLYCDTSDDHCGKN